MDAPVVLKGVTFSRDGFVVRNIDLDLPAGSVVTIGGDDGSGKSTLLKMAAGLIEPDDGDVFLFGHHFWKLKDTERFELKKKVSFFFQEGTLIANMTIFDNLALPLRYHRGLGKKEVESRIYPWLKKFGLYDQRLQLPAELTLKFRHRISLVRALLVERPGIYFWDGPEFLEDDARAVVVKTITEARSRGISSLMVSNSPWTKELSDTRFKLVDGTLKPW